jgi:hypothetical protein
VHEQTGIGILEISKSIPLIAISVVFFGALGVR